MLRRLRSAELSDMCWVRFGLFYELEGLSDGGVGCFTIRASYQTFVLNLSIDKRQGLCDITTML
jgi:anti-sigma regulatory factor (Ser/Thr protein kinase)